MTGGARPNLFQMSSKVLAMLEPELAVDGLEILDVRVFQGGGRVQVRIYVDLADSEETGVGINIDQCARAGRSVNMLMEEADLFAGEYVLEVSSPGIRRPLRLIRHYEAVVGEKVDLKIRLGSKSRRLRGVLVSATGGLLKVQKPRPADEDSAEVDDSEFLEEVLLSQVLEGNLDPEFDAKALINAARRQEKEERRAKRLAKKKPKKGRPKNRDKKASGEPKA